MFCKYCGYKLADDANFCPKCGKLVLEPEPEITTAPIQEKSIAEDQVTGLEPVYIEQEEEPVYYVEPNEMELAPEVEAEKNSLGKNILVWGILALAFADTAIFSILGIIFGNVAKGKVKKYQEKFGDTDGKATVGKVFANISVPLSIGLMAFFFLYFLIYAVILVGLL